MTGNYLWCHWRLANKFSEMHLCVSDLCHNLLMQWFVTHSVPIHYSERWSFFGQFDSNFIEFKKKIYVFHGGNAFYTAISRPNVLMCYKMTFLWTNVERYWRYPRMADGMVIVMCTNTAQYHVPVIIRWISFASMTSILATRQHAINIIQANVAWYYVFIASKFRKLRKRSPKIPPLFTSPILYAVSIVATDGW